MHNMRVNRTTTTTMKGTAEDDMLARCGASLTDRCDAAAVFLRME